MDMRILIVEDEAKLAAALKRGLEDERYVVEVAEDGDEGMSYACNDDYDLILLDWMLPERSGEEVCRALRKEGVKTPIIMLTARGEVGDKVRALDVGADDYLVKPVAFEELLARIRAILRRPGEHSGPVLEIDDLSLDPGKFLVTRGGKQLELSAKEFALLEYFMRHPNQTIPKDTLLTHVWDYERDVLPNTVEVYVGYLRRKIDLPDSTPLLHTVRGIGYRLGGPA